MGKEKKKHKEETVDSFVDQSTTEEKGLSYEQKLQAVNPIAKPIANKKLAKKLYKLIRKAAKHKKFALNGLKLVQNTIRKGERGLVVFGGNITPVDMMCHLPAVCEEKNLPYVYTPCCADLGKSMGANRICLMVLVKSHEDYQELYDECVSEVKQLPIPVFQP